MKRVWEIPILIHRLPLSYRLCASCSEYGYDKFSMPLVLSTLWDILYFFEKVSLLHVFVSICIAMRSIKRSNVANLKNARILSLETERSILLFLLH